VWTDCVIPEDQQKQLDQIWIDNFIDDQLITDDDLMTPNETDEYQSVSDFSSSTIKINTDQSFNVTVSRDVQVYIRLLN
jgi:pSer/pThr/pTyr-binding forkhead associated (FHA) protein